MNFIAVDLGASSGRCALGAFDGEKLSLEMAYRFPNGPVEACGHWYWDALNLYQRVKEGLAKIARQQCGNIAAIGVDSWGVDFALLDREGKLVSNPYCARDPQTREIYTTAIYPRIGRENLFRSTGIQFMEINSLCQLAAMQARQDPAYLSASIFLHIADLMNYWLSGVKACEYTNASTSQMLDVRTRGWSWEVVEAMGFPRDMFPPVVSPGEHLANLRIAVGDETGLGGIPLIATVAHDTAAAVVAVPARREDFGYISSGTWALLGRELASPLLGEQVLAYNAGNEGGAFGKVTFLKNIANMWLIQEARRTWAQQGREYTWDEIETLAMTALPFQAFIDPDDPAFMLPGDMPSKVQQACAQSRQRVPQTNGEILRVILESLALKYRYTNDRLTTLTDRPIKVMHVVGGGSQNRLLNQMTADALQLPVEAGPAEATTLGNVLVQMLAMGLLSTADEARELVHRSFPVETYEPYSKEAWDEAYIRFLMLTGLAS